METTGVGAVIDETTAALSKLDAVALRQLETRARGLRRLPEQGADLAEVRARFRVFAHVLRETDRGLRILGRVRGEGDAWER